MNRPFIKRLLIPLLLITAVIGFLIWKNNQMLPGVVRQDGNVYLIENNSTCYLIWKSLGIKDATLVHLDTHDDCRKIPDHHLVWLEGLSKNKAWDEIYKHSDIDNMINFKVRQEEMLYDLGNFIYPCLKDGTVSTFYWVVPDKEIQANTKEMLQEHIRHILDIPELYLLKDNGALGFSFDYEGASIIITTLDGLPTLPPGAVIDFDNDFFSFPSAMSDDHLPNELQWAPEKVCDILVEKVPDPTVISVCSSVSGGYLPTIMRFIPDACFDYFTSGHTYPAEAKQYMETVISIRRNEHYISPLPDAPNAHLDAARKYIRGCRLITIGKEQEGLEFIDDAVKHNPIYRLGYLDLARATTKSGQYKKAEQLLDLLDESTGTQSVLSMRQRAHIYLAKGMTEEADQLVSQLVLWSRDHMNLSLLGAVLLQQNKVKAAEEIYREAISLYPHSSENIYSLGVVLHNTKNLDALEMYKQAFLLNPSLYEAVYNAAILLSEHDKIEEAIALLQDLVRKDPSNTTHVIHLAKLANTSGRFELAYDTLSQAYNTEPKNPDILIELGVASKGLNQLTAAIKYFSEALGVLPMNSRAHYLLGATLLENGSPSEALRFLDFAHRETTDNKEGPALLLAQAYHHLGQFDKALELYRKVERITPSKGLTQLIHKAENSLTP